MAKVVFSIGYEVIPDRMEEYLTVIKELKNIVKAEGLESYSVYREKKNEKSFREVYIFSDIEAYENFDEDPDERIDILMTKLSDMIKEHSTRYETLFEVEL